MKNENNKKTQLQDLMDKNRPVWTLSQLAKELSRHTDQKVSTQRVWAWKKGIAKTRDPEIIKALGKIFKINNANRLFDL